MLNYNEYTSCLDTRLYKSGRKIGVTSHRRHDSQCGDDGVLPPPTLFAIPPRKRLLFLAHAIQDHVHLHLQLGIVFLDREPHMLHVRCSLRRPFCCIENQTIWNILAILLGSHRNSGSLCVIMPIVSMLLISGEKIGSIGRSVNLCPRNLICTIWRRPKSLLRSAMPIM